MTTPLALLSRGWHWDDTRKVYLKDGNPSEHKTPEELMEWAILEFEAIRASLSTVHPELDVGDSYTDLWQALHTVDTAAVMLPTFEVKHSGGIKAVAKNIVEAIQAAIPALSKETAHAQ